MKNLIKDSAILAGFTSQGSMFRLPQLPANCKLKLQGFKVLRKKSGSEKFPKELSEADIKTGKYPVTDYWVCPVYEYDGTEFAAIVNGLPFGQQGIDLLLTSGEIDVTCKEKLDIVDSKPVKRMQLEYIK